MVAVAEGVRVIADADARHRARGERQPGDDHVDRAERQPLVDIRFLPKRRRGEDVDMVLAVGALLDFARRPYRPFVIGLRGFVYVCPLQLRLGERGARSEHHYRSEQR